MNYGNIMFLAGMARTSVIGLDMYDPNSGQSNLTARGGFEPLNILIEPGARHEFARKCVTSVGATMKRELGGNRKVPPMAYISVKFFGTEVVPIEVATMENLFLAFAPCFEQGITRGATNLKQYLLLKVQQYKVQGRALPQGIIDRMMWLNWMPAPDRPATNAPGRTPQQMQAQARYHGSRHRHLAGGDPQ